MIWVLRSEVRADSALTSLRLYYDKSIAPSKASSIVRSSAYSFNQGCVVGVGVVESEGSLGEVGVGRNF
jgi:hypothetical protein